jgi:hypothetical protein
VGKAWAVWGALLRRCASRSRIASIESTGSGGSRTLEFQERLQRAVERGQQARDSRSRKAADRALSEEESRTLHSEYRLELSDHIGTCLGQLVDQFPGFQLESIVGEEGWGAVVNRDDIALAEGGKSTNLYSRMQMLIRPYSEGRIVELVVKATIRNREVFNRARYQMLGQVDLESFAENVDLWVLEYAELYSAAG